MANSPEQAANIYMFELYNLLRKSSDHMRLAHILASFLRVLADGNLKVTVPEELMELAGGLKDLSTYIESSLIKVDSPPNPVDPQILN